MGGSSWKRLSSALKPSKTSSDRPNSLLRKKSGASLTRSSSTPSAPRESTTSSSKASRNSSVRGQRVTAFPDRLDELEEPDAHDSNVSLTRYTVAPYYSALRPAKKEFRILHLQPGNWRDRISCYMSTISLTAPHLPYEALSYVRDVGNGLEEILLEGIPYRIKQNLFLALRRLRKAHDVRTIWVDALCIDQSNDEERGSQVELTGEVYRSCSRAFLWLGDDQDPDYNPRTVESNIEFPWFGGTKKRDCGRKDDVYRAFEFLHGLTMEKHLEFDDEIVAGLSSIGSSPWWERLWTVQETILPPNATIVYGANSAPFEMLKAADTAIALHRNLCCRDAWSSFVNSEALSTVVRRLKLHLMALSNISRSDNALDVIWNCRNRKTSNSLDVIYGLLGLACNELAHIKVDYSINKEELYRQVTLSLIGGSGNLRVLKGERVPTKGWPSWIYDWSSPIDARIWQRERTQFSTGLYHASRREQAIITDTNDKNQLCLDGVLVDRIVDVSKAWIPRVEAIQRWYALCEANFTASGTNQTQWLASFGRTITADTECYSKSPRNKSKAPIRAQGKRDNIFYAWWTIMSSGLWSDATGFDDPEIARFHSDIGTMSEDRSFFLTEKGHMGLGNTQTSVGDEVWVLLGGDMPFLLRPDKGTTHHFLLGDCYIHGYMDGEALAHLEEGRDLVVLI